MDPKFIIRQFIEEVINQGRFDQTSKYVHDANKRSTMSQQAKTLAKPDAAESIAGVLIGMINAGK